MEGQYTTYFGNRTWKQYRGSGKDHGDVPRPNIKEALKFNQNPKTGELHLHKPTYRKPNPGEYPK
nr:hypothetical protein GTC16762_26510 [Pigmentibacter ruber]